jgi:hypothetical protein
MPLKLGGVIENWSLKKPTKIKPLMLMRCLVPAESRLLLDERESTMTAAHQRFAKGWTQHAGRLTPFCCQRMQQMKLSDH